MLRRKIIKFILSCMLITCLVTSSSFPGLSISSYADEMEGITGSDEVFYYYNGEQVEKPAQGDITDWYDGYVAMTKNGTQVTVKAVAHDGFDFMMLSLTDENGNVTTPLSKDYFKSGPNSNIAINEDYSCTFTVGEVTESPVDDGIGLSYSSMPEITAYFDKQGELLNDELLAGNPVESNGDKVENIIKWLKPEATLNAGKAAWDSTHGDVGKGHYVSYYAGEGKLFDLNAISIYSRYGWTSNRFTARIEGSFDGTYFVNILETTRGTSLETNSIKRMMVEADCQYPYIRISGYDSNTDVCALKLYGTVKSEMGSTYLLYKNGIQTGRVTGEELSTVNPSTYDGYVKMTVNGNEVTVTPAANEGYDFMMLNLTDDNGYVATPLSKDYVQTGANSNKKITGTDYSYTFAVSSDLSTYTDENKIGLQYSKMPEITAYFDKQSEVINNDLREMIPMTQLISNESKSIVNWIGANATLNAGKRTWDGVDVANGDFVTYYAGKGNAFCINEISIYSRRTFSDTRFTAIVEGSNDGITFYPILETVKASAKEANSIKRITESGDYKYRSIRIRALGNNTNVCLLKFYGEISPVADSDLTEGGKTPIEETDVPEITDYVVTINSETSEAGFIHPGIGPTKEVLENIQKQIRDKKDPWYTYYLTMVESDYASAAFKCNNSSDGVIPNNVSYTSQSMRYTAQADSLRSYTQSLLYVITGNETYRENAIKIIRVWEQMDPDQYAYYTDSHIQTGIPLYGMVMAAEILKYTSCESSHLIWTDEDNDKFIKNVIDPTVETFINSNGYYMNQHNYPLYGTLSAAIFKDDRAAYDEKVEWLTVNASAPDLYMTGSIYWMFREITKNDATGEDLEPEDYHVQQVEMGRDLAHGAGDVINMTTLARIVHNQNTKVDPSDGTVSTSESAVNIYEFLNDRILEAADYFCQQAEGYDIEWTPVKSEAAKSTAQEKILMIPSDQYLGRMQAMSIADLYYKYIYELGYTEAELTEKAPYYMKAFKERNSNITYYAGNGESADVSLSNLWDDLGTGGEYWIYIPEEVLDSGDYYATYVPEKMSSKEKYILQLENNFSIIDGSNEIIESTDLISKETDNGTSYIHMTASDNHTLFACYKIHFINRKNTSLVSLRVRTDGPAKLELKREKNSDPFCTLNLPDTKEQWKYVTFDMGYDSVTSGQFSELTFLMYFNIVGDGTTVDIDSMNINSGSSLTVPVFNHISDSDMDIVIASGDPYTFDFSASDPNKMNTVTYELQTWGNELNGASLDRTTGKFEWNPSEAQVGEYTANVFATNGTALSMVKLSLTVTNDRSAALDNLESRYNSEIIYELNSEENYRKAQSKLKEIAGTAASQDFYDAVSRVISSLRELKHLNDLLNDGSLNYPAMISKTSLGDGKLYSLIDNNTVSFTGDLFTRYFTIDFGNDFRVKAEGFEVQPRNMWPERTVGTIIYGSNDGKNWTRLTDESEYSDEKVRLEVYDDYRDTEFQYFKVSTQEAVNIYAQNNKILSLGEFRIYGTRTEIPN